jgi:nucleoside-diphosphate-sugar epimerase
MDGGEAPVTPIMDSEKPSSVMVTGGRGFVGRSLGKLLRRHRYRLISVDVTPLTAGSDESLCNIEDLAQLRKLFQRHSVDAIVHLAAILPTAAQREPLLATRVNVQGSVNLLELAREFHVRRFVFGSSLSVYGTCPPDQVLRETDRAAPEDLYGAAKLYVEQLGAAYRQAHQLEFVSLRIGRVVGPGARSATSAWRSEIFERLGNVASAEIEIPYADSERILLVHVEDVARMLVHLLQVEHPGHDIYNAASESLVVGELRGEVERLHPGVRLKSGGRAVVGNPRRVDWSRWAEEFRFRTVPIFEQLRAARGSRAHTPEQNHGR